MRGLWDLIKVAMIFLEDFFLGILWESMKFLWIFFDGSMIFLWCFYWVPVGFPWYFYRFLVDPCVISMGFPWWFFGISLGFQRGVYEALKNQILNIICSYCTRFTIVHPTLLVSLQSLSPVLAYPPRN